MNFPDFNTWHKVPRDATIPAGTPYWRFESENNIGYYISGGRSQDYDLRNTSSTYYTEQPITDPDEAANWQKAEKMYRTAYSSLDDAWEYQTQDTKDRWYALAKKYDEKEN